MILVKTAEKNYVDILKMEIFNVWENKPKKVWQVMGYIGEAEFILFSHPVKEIVEKICGDIVGMVSDTAYDLGKLEESLQDCDSIEKADEKIAKIRDEQDACGDPNCPNCHPENAGSEWRGASRMEQALLDAITGREPTSRKNYQ